MYLKKWILTLNEILIETHFLDIILFEMKCLNYEICRYNHVLN